MTVYRLTKLQKKDRERVYAWREGYPFAENSRDKNPVVPELDLQFIIHRWVPDDYANFGRYYTALETVSSLLKMPRVDPMQWAGKKVLDPCGGVGSLIHSLPRQAQIVVYEIDYDAWKIGQKLNPHATWVNADPFDHLDELVGHFDYVVMNAPWGLTAGMGTAQDKYALLKRSEHLFMLLAANALVPGGEAYIVATQMFGSSFPKAGEARLKLLGDLEPWGQLDGRFELTDVVPYGYHFTRKQFNKIAHVRATDFKAEQYIQVPPDVYADLVGYVNHHSVSLWSVKPVIADMRRLHYTVAARWVAENPQAWGNAVMHGFVAPGYPVVEVEHAHSA